jgi:hypothetical protein
MNWCLGQSLNVHGGRFPHTIKGIKTIIIRTKTTAAVTAIVIAEINLSCSVYVEGSTQPEWNSARAQNRSI